MIARFRTHPPLGPLLPILVVLASLAGGCGDGATAQLPPVDEPDAAMGGEVEPLDTSAPVDDAAVDDTGENDGGGTSDTSHEAGDVGYIGPGETGGGSFACGTATCSTTLQFCRRQTSPGICPPPGSEFCPAGCEGCPPLPVQCETLPMKCWSKPSCNCILVESCGSVLGGDCEEKDGGFTVGCRGV